MKNERIRKITGAAILTAIVIILQMMGSFIKLGPFSVSLVLIPIVVGAAIYGPLTGAWLGRVFSRVVLFSGDAAPFLAVSVGGTIATVIAKGTIAGLCAGLAYKSMKGRKTAAAVCAALCCPVVNTGLFLIGCILFFMPTVSSWASALGFENVWSYMILGLVGGNFLFEVLTDIILVPVIVKVIDMGRNR